ncbi:MAG: DUF4348 domain-containing protein, partial [Prevotellaceae bacterium]|nr:DUF4348 domain-containing protein [Prevotellaceae bacterium]
RPQVLLKLLYIIPSLGLGMSIGIHSVMSGFVAFLLVIAVIVQAIRNHPTVKWWGLALVAIAIAASVSRLFVVIFSFSLPVLGIAIYDIIKWLKAGNTLKWKMPELHKNPIVLIVAAAVLTAVISFSSMRRINNARNDFIEYANFPNFIQKFIADKDFQLAHVKFPLKSIGVTKNNWKSKLSGAFNYEGDVYKQSDNEYNYQTNIEDVFLTAVFKKIDGQWYLTDAQYSVCDD